VDQETIVLATQYLEDHLQVSHTVLLVVGMGHMML
jgi:hypothetical protein